MASYGVRILENSEGILKFRLVILNPDYYLFPRTHAFGLYILWEGLKRQGWGNNEMLAGFLSTQFVLGEFRAKAPVMVGKMELSNFRNLRDPSEKERIRSRLNPDKTGFTDEDILPSADYLLELRIPASAGHISPEMVWESDGKEMDEMRHYLERKEGDAVFFIDSSMDGKWHLMRMGKTGEEGETLRNRTANYSKVVQAIRKKQDEGYQLVYQNYDTEFGTEFDLLRAAEEENEI